MTGNSKQAGNAWKAERDSRLVETLQVLSQPHRRGDASQMAGSELGRFILANITAELCGEGCSIVRYRGEVYDAALHYARVIWGLNVAKGIPMPSRMAWDFSNGEAEGDEETTIAAWEKSRKLYESGLKRAGMRGFMSSRDLIVFDLPVVKILASPARRALEGLHAVVWI